MAYAPEVKEDFILKQFLNEHNVSSETYQYCVGKKLSLKSLRISARKKNSNIVENLSSDKKSDLDKSNLLNFTEAMDALAMSRKNYREEDFGFIKKGKLVLIGDSGVGKSSIIKSYLEDSFQDQHHQSTVNVDQWETVIKIKEDHGLKLSIVDPPGQHRFQNIVIQSSMVRDADCIFFVYSVWDKESFYDLPKWNKFIKENSVKDPEFIIIGNQIDRVPNEFSRFIGRVDASLQVKEWFGANCYYEETSAKTGLNINHLFDRAADNIHKKLEKEFKNNIEPRNLTITEQRQNKNNSSNSGSCC